MQVPCYNCPDRKFKCHSTCEKYLAFRAWRESVYEHRLKESEFEGYRHNHYDYLAHTKHIKKGSTK